MSKDLQSLNDALAKSPADFLKALDLKPDASLKSVMAALKLRHVKLVFKVKK